MGRFPESWMAELLSRNDIVSVVSDYVTLNNKGGRLWGLCPFHSEKTPSFSVQPDKQFYYCFGCHAGGSAIQFVMEIEKLSYGEAVRFLAERVKMHLPEEIDDDALRRDRERKERLYAVCNAAARFFYESLVSPDGKRAISYLEGRGIGQGAIRRFGLGYAPESWDALSTYLLKEGFTDKEIVDAGLAYSKTRLVDVFRARVTFPIFNAMGRVVGFGARAMGDEMPKYLNSAETPIFNKRQCLYGLSLMKGKKHDAMVIVEGYMDVVSLNSHGVTNAVASLGTALTAHQARLLKRYVNKVYIAYDGDAAGQAAMIRALQILSGEGLNARVAAMPPGNDPDDVVRAQGNEGFQAILDKSLSVGAFMLLCFKRKHDLSTEDGREAYAREACVYIGGLEPLERERYYAQVSRETGYPIAAVQAQSDQNTRKSAENEEKRQIAHRISRPRNTRDSVSIVMPPEYEQRERTLLHAMSVSREAALAAQEGAHEFRDPVYSRFASMLASRYETKQELGGEDIALMLGELEAEEAERIAPVLSDDPPDDPAAVAKDCIEWLDIYRQKQEIDEMQQKLESGMLEREESRSVAQKIMALRRQLHEKNVQSLK